MTSLTVTVFVAALVGWSVGAPSDHYPKVPMTLEPLDCEGDPISVGIRWEYWKRALIDYLEEYSIEESDKKMASLLHIGGLELQEVLYDISDANITLADNVDVFEVAMAKLDTYFTPNQSELYERHLFRLLKQASNEEFVNFIVTLEKQAEKCQFKDVTENHDTEKCWLSELRNKILETGDELTLESIIMEANSLEELNKQIEEYVSNPNRDVSQNPNNIEDKQKEIIDQKTERPGCARCGNPRQDSDEMKCPARDTNCLNCVLKGHFRRFCKTKQTFTRKAEVYKNRDTQKKNQMNGNKVGDDQISDSVHKGLTEEINNVFQIDDDNEFDCNIGGVKTKMLVDSDSEINILTRETWELLKEYRVCTYNKQANTDKKIMAFYTALNISGAFEACIQVGNKSETSTFYVVDGSKKDLLGKTTAMSLDLL